MDVTHIKLAIRHHIAEATKALHHPDLDDEAVHGARKDLKRARSGLRLLRPLDEAAYRRENARLRDAGRWLSGVRDDKVLLGMLAKLLEREKKPKGRRLLERLMARLEKERQRDWRAVRTAKRRRELREVLGETAHRVDAWHAPHAHTPVPAAALKQLYRKVGAPRKCSSARARSATGSARTTTLPWSSRASRTCLPRPPSRSRSSSAGWRSAARGCRRRR